ncbi:adenylate/guanylate cyclase domain-containing protein [Natronosporangium hydrolyticum]|uniref:Adenylate/guanylate cyclase domain-containing protein n=1 Tax=Natronosporangium hydrolyticum TaxID=2811111 RepID=A0A895YBK9_9ACTN|nr:adenylate/guanylate cyclase domain-containing protein [Natronosporangium hydrolyticum]QSB15194.1 adenylate/guanylate cyclase domain-containing protein [Natronosporangium hydrolyticum]
MTARTNLPSGLVTFLITDIEGSTRLAQLLGPDYGPVLAAHRRLLRSALRTDGGVELFAEGDSFFFAFPDAATALSSCRAAQHTLTGHSWPHDQAQPKVRMGLHSGYARPSNGEYASPEVHRAARIAAAAHGGQVLCSAATAGHAVGLEPDAWLRDLGLYRLRGFDGRERLFQLVAPGLDQGFPSPRTERAAAHNLPAPITSFVGRHAERSQVAALLDQHRLVTVAGAGGAGKTRLANVVAADQLSRYPDGVWFADLAAVTDPRLVAVAVASALGLRPEPGRPMLRTLAEYVAQRRMLLVLDTCDAQIVAAAAVATAILGASAGTRLLATSREPLGIPGELVWRIPPLSTAQTGDGQPGDAVALLAERTVAARGGAPVPAAELPELARVAARLAGLPLAIELAAGRLRVLGAGQLADRVEAEAAGPPGDLLATIDAGPPGWSSGTRPVALPTASPAFRHTTLEAAVGWSYRTLAPQHARLLRGLSVFAGPVDLATAEWLLGGDPLPALTVLVDKSLLHADGPPAGDGEAGPGFSYRMLDPIRAFVARELASAGEETAAHQRHVNWLVARLRRGVRDPHGQPVTLSLHHIDRYADEIRAALHFCVTGGAASDGLRLARMLDLWWRERGLAREGRLWLFRLYGRLAETEEELGDRLLAEAYHVHSLLAGADGEYAEQHRYAQQAEETARRVGDAGLLARVLATRAWSLMDLSRPAEAEQVCRELIDWSAERGVPADALFAVTCLVQLLWRRSALAEAAALLSRARPFEQARPDVRGRRAIDHLLGVVALSRGDLVAAHDHLVVALRSRMAYGFHTRACETLAAMAARCGLGGDPVTAARLFGAVHTHRARLRSPHGGFAGYWTSLATAVRASLGDDRFDAAYGAGAAMTLSQAVAVALEVDQEVADLDPA